MQAQPEPSKASHEQFIVWFKAQNFYTNLAFAHGDRLFDFEQSENTFRVLAVQTAWCVWQKQQKQIDELRIEKSLQEMGVNQLAQANHQWRITNDKLQARVDAVKGLAQALWEKSNDKHNQGKVWESKALGECADEILDVLEQALKGGEV